mmetsp:Transcript_52495/g.86907  ORF Transcript_52495/g.86907 Transcript_52495/m.86907 type:complete len:598 (+) Transcript_52495:160-1953(+)
MMRTFQTSFVLFSVTCWHVCVGVCVCIVCPCLCLENVPYFYIFFPVTKTLSTLDSSNIMSDISSTIYYSSVSEAITTFIVISVATVVSLIVFTHTVYKFFCEQISSDDASTIQKSTLQTSQTSRVAVHPPSQFPSRARSHSESCTTTRTHLPSLAISKRWRSGSHQQHHTASHHKEISFLIAALTLCYLFFAALYTFLNFLIRLLMIFFGFNISCYALGWVQVCYVCIRIAFYCLFTVRLHLTFRGSNMEIKLLYLRLLCGVSVTLLIAAFIYFLFDVNRQFEAADNDCSKTADFNLVRPLLPAVIVDTVTSMLLLYLFIHKLSVLIRAQTSSVESFAHASQSTLQRIRALVLVSTKLTVLVCVYIVAYWLLYVLFFPVLPGAAVMMELCIGCVITVWCYEFHVHHYNKYCFPCKWCCFHICFWWFIFCKEDSDARHRFNVCEICCALESKATRKNQQSLSERKRTSNTKHEVMLSTVIQSDAEYKHEVDTQQSAQNTQSTKVSDKISAVSNAIVNHEKTGTFVIHLQDELKASDDNVHDNDDDDDDDGDDGDDGVKESKRQCENSDDEIKDIRPPKVKLEQNKQQTKELQAINEED